MSKEPSMEDILSSIRRVIARDDPATAPARRPALSGHRTSFSDPAAHDRQDEDDRNAEGSGRRVANGMDDRDVLELGQNDSAPDAAHGTAPAAPSPAVPSPPATSAVDAEAAGLVSADSMAAARHSLEELAAALATAPAPGTPATDIAGGTTVEELVLKALRPMLRDWLDSNLPPLVEGIVAREIARITGRRC